MEDSAFIIQDIIKILNQESEQIGVSYFTKWRLEAGQLLQLAQLYQQKYDKLSNIAIKTAENFASVLLQEQKQDIETQDLITKMYRFLNEVGETLRGEIIRYEVTLSSGKGKHQTLQTFNLSLDQFLSITAQTSTRITLRHTTSVLRILEAQQVVGKQWTEKELEAFERYKKNVKRNQQGKWKKINKGNLLEGFRRQQIKQMSTTGSIMETMSGTQGFWQGGDIDLLQIKGDRASVTNFKTCVHQIQILFDTLNKLNPEVLQNLQNKLDASKENVNQVLQEEIDINTTNVLKDIQKQFFTI